MTLERAVLASAALALLVSGCGNPPARVPVQLQSFAGAIVTNSPMRVATRDPEPDKDRLAFVYSVIAENVGNERVDFDLSGASVIAGDSVGKPTCTVRGSSIPAFALYPGDRWRIDCRVGVPRELVRMGDVQAILDLPVQAGAERASFRLAYWLRTEDAS